MPLLQLGVGFYNPTTGTVVGPPSPSVNSKCTLYFNGTYLMLIGGDGIPTIRVPAASGKPGSSRSDVNTPTGPIPPGEYWVDPCCTQRYDPRRAKCWWNRGPLRQYYDDDPIAWGRERACIKPVDIPDMHIKYPNRRAFEDRDKDCVFTIHGGDEVGSHGCIDIRHKELMFFDAARMHCGCGNLKLIVDYGPWNGRVPGGKGKVRW